MTKITSLCKVGFTNSTRNVFMDLQKIYEIQKKLLIKISYQKKRYLYQQKALKSF